MRSEPASPSPPDPEAMDVEPTPPSTSRPRRRSRWDRLRRGLSVALRSRFVWILLGLVSLSLALDHWVDSSGGAKAVVQRWGYWAPAVSFVVQTITTMTPVGAVFIAVVNGMLFPLWLAVLINISSGVIGGIGMYFVWRRGDHEFDIQRHMRRLPSWAERLVSPRLGSLILLRLLPWAGGGLADLIAGARRVPLWVQIVSLICGYLPGSVVYALMGAGLIAVA